MAKAYVTKITNQIKYADRGCQPARLALCLCHGVQKRRFSSASQSDFVYCDPPLQRRARGLLTISRSEQERAGAVRFASARCPAKFILSTWHSNQYRDQSRHPE
ncbi:MAG: hypothetical protein MZU91_02065 [Desulfosudis oleivorans]|nr:hypothetical protein [Desulfosudis oleivorans]